MQLSQANFSLDEVNQNFIGFMEPDPEQFAFWRMACLDAFIGTSMSSLHKEINEMKIADGMIVTSHRVYCIATHPEKGTYWYLPNQKILDIESDLLEYLDIFVFAAENDIIMQSREPFNIYLSIVTNLSRYYESEEDVEEKLRDGFFERNYYRSRGKTYEGFRTWLAKRQMQREEELVVQTIHDIKPEDHSLPLIALGTIYNETHKRRNNMYVP